MSEVIHVDFQNKNRCNLTDLAAKAIVWYETVRTQNPEDLEAHNKVWNVAGSYLAQLTIEQQEAAYDQAQTIMQEL